MSRQACAAAAVLAGNSKSSAFSWLPPQPNTEERQTTARVAKADEIIVCCCFTRGFSLLGVYEHSPSSVVCLFACRCGFCLLVFILETSLQLHLHMTAVRAFNNWFGVIVEPQTKASRGAKLIGCSRAALCLDRTLKRGCFCLRRKQEPVDFSAWCIVLFLTSLQAPAEATEEGCAGLLRA